MANKKKNKKSVVTFMNFARRGWEINPVQRVKQSKKNYNRKNKDWKKDL